jgi:hypothetical protein
MTTSDKVRSVRRLTRKDRKFEDLLGRTVSLFQRGTQRRQLETIQKKSQLIASPEQPEENGFNQKAVIPFGLSTEHIYKSMMDFSDFMGFIDTELRSQEIARFEDMLTAPNFNSMVREFMSTTIPKYCKTVMKNRQYNGHPDIVRAGMYSNDSIGDAGGNGIEVRASRYLKNWQGHPDEKSWLMIFVFQSGRLNPKVTEHVRFKFLLVAGGLLSKDDWLNAGYPEISRTVNTQTITRVGAQKIMTNWIYKCKELRESRADFTHNLLSNEQA